MPLFVKLPDQRAGRVVDAPVRTVDVLPTIAAAAGVRVPWRTDGRPAGEVTPDPDARIEVSAAGRARAVPGAPGVLARRRARSAHEQRLLARGTFATGPRPDLLGRRVSTRVPVRSRATVDDTAAYTHLVDGAEVLPAFVSGRVRGVRADRSLAIAVDGRVVATTRAYPEGGRMTYRVLVPPAALAAGRSP